MRVRASFTIENTVVIPVFTIIIVFLAVLLLYLHDSAVVKNALIQSAVKAEKEVLDKSSSDTKSVLSQLSSQAEAYIEEKTAAVTSVHVNIKVSGTSIITECEGCFSLGSILMEVGDFRKEEQIKRSYPPAYIRTIRAAQKNIS